jgi:hypothetical protein
MIFLYPFYTFFTFFPKWAFYYSHVTNLNFWDTNILIMCSIILCIVKVFEWLFNYFSVFYLFSLTNFNTLISIRELLPTLLVGTVTIHPILFYISLSIFFCKFLFKNKFSYTNTIVISLKSLTLLLFLTLSLGGFWSLQSNMWGYFWVNDAVEWTLLVLVCYVLLRIHVLTTTTLSINYNLFFFIIFTFLILIRLNFVPTRHNFIATQQLFFMLLLVYNLFFEYLRKSHTHFNSYLDKIFTASYLVFFYFLVSTYFTLIFKWYFNWWVSYFFLKSIFYYIKNYAFHTIVIVVSLLWSSLYFFFNVLYLLIPHYSLKTLSLLSNELNCFYHFYFVLDQWTILERVQFNEMFLNVFCFNLSYILNLIEVLNNFSYLYLYVFLFIFSKKGWI